MDFSSNRDDIDEQKAQKILDDCKSYLTAQQHLKGGVATSIGQYDMTINIVNMPAPPGEALPVTSHTPSEAMIRTLLSTASVLYWPADRLDLLAAFLPLGSRDVAADPRPYSLLQSRENEKNLTEVLGRERLESHLRVPLDSENLKRIMIANDRRQRTGQERELAIVQDLEVLKSATPLDKSFLAAIGA